MNISNLDDITQISYLNAVKKFINDYSDIVLPEDISLEDAQKVLVDVVMEMQDIIYIDKCIEMRKELGLNSWIIMDLILATGDIDYIKEYIVDNELGLDSNTVKMLIIRVVETLNLDSDTIRDVILYSRKNSNLNSYDIRFLMRAASQTTEQIKSSIEETRLGLESDIIRELILETRDTTYIKICIKNYEKLGLSLSAIPELAMATGDLDFIRECINENTKFNLSQEDIQRLSVFVQETKIDLPSEMKCGTEIESEGKEKINETIITQILSQTNTDWVTANDASLLSGIEVKSPILTENFERASDEIRSVCSVLTGVSQTVSERCGGHIHIGADFLTKKQDLVNLIQIWANAEKVLYIISNEEGEIPRDGVIKFAKPISKKIEQAIEKGTINLESEEDLDKFVEQLKEVQKEDEPSLKEARYFGINFLNIGTVDKNTIEFRLPNGTMNPNTWIENINLFGGIVRSAHELTEIQEKKEEERTEEEKEMLKCLEILQTSQDEEQIANALINLCIQSEQRQIYRNRYTVNKTLFESSEKINTAITEKISVKKIVAKVFEGENALNGIDFQKGSEIITTHLNEMSIEYDREE